MNRRHAIGLADLALACLALRPREDENELKIICRVLGLEVKGGDLVKKRLLESTPDIPREVIVSDASIDTPELEDGDALHVDEADVDTAPYSPNSIQRRMQRSLISGLYGRARGAAGKKAIKVEPLETPDRRTESCPVERVVAWIPSSGAQVMCASPAPLVPPKLRRSTLINACSALAPSSEVDVSSLTTTIARGVWPRRIPYRMRRQVARSLHVLIDTSESMVPFLDEAKAMTLSVRKFLYSDHSRITWTNGPPNSNQPDLIRPWPTLSRGDTLLTISLIGLGAKASERNAWLLFARRAVRRGVRLVALTPALPVHWSGRSERRLWNLVPWMRRGCQHAVATEADIEPLAAVLSIFAHPSPAVLREARHLVMPHVEPYVESMLIRSSHVGTAFRSRLVMRQFDMVARRQLLIVRPDLLKVSRNLANKGNSYYIEDASLSTRNSEELWLHAWQTPYSMTADTELLLSGLVRELQENQSNQTLARSALGLLFRLPDSVSTSRLGQIAQLLIRTALQQPLDEDLLELAAEHESWLYPKSVLVGIAWTGSKLFIRDRARSGDVLVSLPDTPNRAIRIDWGHSLGSEWRYYPRGEREIVDAARLPVSISNLRGQTFSLSLRNERDSWAILQRSLSEQIALDAEILMTLRTGDKFYGWLVDVGITAFLPAHQMRRDQPDEDPERWVSKSVRVVVIELERSFRLVVVSADRAAFALTEDPKSVLSALQIGQTVLCRFKQRIGQFVLVRLGAVEGRFPAHQLPADYEPKKFDLLACTLKEVDFERFTVVVDLLDPTPQLEHYFPPQSLVKGFLRDLSGTGALVEMAPGIHGLASWSELPWRKSQLDEIRVELIGQKMEAKILSVRHGQINATLSLKSDPLREFEKKIAGYAIGDIVRVTVSRILHYGAFVTFDNGLVGLLHITDMSWSRLKEVPSWLTVGQSLDVAISAINHRARKVSLSLRMMLPDPWQTFHLRYQPGAVVSGKVSNVVDYGVFLELEPGLEGLMHVSEMTDHHGKPIPPDRFSLGQSLNVVILYVDTVKRRVSLRIA